MLPIEPPIDVPEGWRRIVFAKDQKEYIPLPAILENGEYGHAITCWKLSWTERFKLFFDGQLWLTVMTFKKPLQPIRIGVNPPEFTE